jgi:hypothetical protein
MKRRNTIWVGLAVITFLAAATAEEPGRDNKARLVLISGGAQAQVTSPPNGDRVTYAQVVLWDVSPGQSQTFESAVRKQLSGLKSGSDFINARVLRNLNELNLQYATYVRYDNRMIAEDSLAKEVALLGPLCWRRPETHLIRLERAYSPAGIKDSPAGTEFAVQGTSQIAHLGMFVPYPRFRKSYDQVLHEVKVQTWEQHNAGYIGEEIGNEVDASSPDQQTPYSPQPAEREAMSINYGEFKTFQQAEASFLAHSGDRLAWGWWRIFFSSLQVPTRFYIFQVVQSYGQSETATRDSRWGVGVSATASVTGR